MQDLLEGFWGRDWLRAWKLTNLLLLTEVVISLNMSCPSLLRTSHSGVCKISVY